MKHFYLVFLFVLLTASTKAQNIVSGAIQSKTSISGSINENCGTNSIISNPLRFTLYQNAIPVLNYQPDNGDDAYEIPIGEGDYEVIPTVNFSDGFDVTPEQFDVSFVENSDEMYVQDLCIEPRVEVVDGLEIRFFLFSYASDPSLNRFDAYILITNTNTANFTGQLRLVYDDNYSFILDTDEIPDSDGNGETIWNSINIESNSVFSRFLRISYNSETHPNYPLLPGDELIYDLFLTAMENRNAQGGAPSFRLTQTVDASEQTLSASEIEMATSQTVMYPNPCNSIINIQNHSSIQGMSMFTINGQLINNLSFLNDTSDRIQIDISNLDTGIYFLAIQTEKTTTIKKVIKN